MAFIETTRPNDTHGEARAMLERQQKSWGFVPNYAKVFSDRADVMDLWADLLAGIRRHIDSRRFELATFAAARELGSSYCVLAHGKVLMERLLTAEEMRSLVEGDLEAFSEGEVAVIELARKVIADASSVTREDVDRLRRAGCGENEIFDVVAAAAARSFFAKMADALGAEPDSSFMELDAAMRERLTVGRPIATEQTERIDEAPPVEASGPVW